MSSRQSTRGTAAQGVVVMRGNSGLGDDNPGYIPSPSPQLIMRLPWIISGSSADVGSSNSMILGFMVRPRTGCQ